MNAREVREAEIEQIIRDTLSKPKGPIYFDHTRGAFVDRNDERESETSTSLKGVMAALESDGDGEISNEIYDAVERLLWKYSILIRAGVRESFSTLHKNISWYISDGAEGRAVIAFQDGTHAEWRHDCWADEVPLWLLVGLFRRITRRKPLGDQVADETISKVDKIDTEYIRGKRDHDPYRSYKTRERRP